MTTGRLLCVLHTAAPNDCVWLACFACLWGVMWLCGLQISMVCCAGSSTAVLTDRSRVFVWGHSVADAPVSEMAPTQRAAANLYVCGGACSGGARTRVNQRLVLSGRVSYYALYFSHPHRHGVVSDRPFPVEVLLLRKALQHMAGTNTEQFRGAAGLNKQAVAKAKTQLQDYNDHPTRRFLPPHPTRYHIGSIALGSEGLVLLVGLSSCFKRSRAVRQEQRQAAWQRLLGSSATTPKLFHAAAANATAAAGAEAGAGGQGSGAATAAETAQAEATTTTTTTTVAAVLTTLGNTKAAARGSNRRILAQVVRKAARRRKK